MRVNLKNTFYHVLNCGVERRVIFDDSQDFEKFIELPGKCSERLQLDVWSFLLLSKKDHLLVKTRQENLSRAIQWLNISYAGYYNW
ncbi:MAG: hypothetical protein O3B01_04325 [Planctomycetota bacterium]|nr:hypothetical protein [Planctomycetota bacterium]MDA1137787.1 hypothetical protein [Planctomycetota bacterium]